MMKRVLVVDDEPSVIGVLLRILRAEGCEAVGAASAEEALDLVAKGNFGLILMDVVLPGMTGFGAIAALRRRCSAPVLLMSGDANDDNTKDAVLLGAIGMIRKPIDVQELQRVVRGLELT